MQGDHNEGSYINDGICYKHAVQIAKISIHQKSVLGMQGNIDFY